jgi:SAM-dependent methyltransferase
VKRYAPAAARNRDFILDLLGKVVPPSGVVLEIASGSGEHAVHFARALPQLRFQPSDPDPTARASIAAWREDVDLPNFAAPIELDVRVTPWPIQSADVIVCINMIHISPWEATLALLDGASRILPPRGVLMLYGPYYVDSKTEPSNVAFDESLRSRDPSWGVRELNVVKEQAETRGLDFVKKVQMPANNLSVVFERRDG